MDRLGEGTRVPVVNVREGDLGVLVAFPIVGLLVGATLEVPLLTGVLAGIGVCCGVGVVYAAPQHVTAWQWLRDVTRYLLFRPRVTFQSHERDGCDGTGAGAGAGGVVAYLPVAIGESTESLTGIRRGWPGVGAVERSDGTMEAFLEVMPANMDFATSREWAAVQRAAESFVNTEVTFPVTVFATTRPFPADQLIQQLEARRDEMERDAHPAFDRLIEEYCEQRPRELTDTRQVSYYLGVEVDPLAVYQRDRQEATPGEKLTRFPVIGFLFNPFVTRRAAYAEAERRAAMFEELERRLRVIRREFIAEVEGWSARQLTTAELIAMTAEFWTGTEYTPEAADRLLREDPVLTRQLRGNDLDDDSAVAEKIEDPADE